MILIKLKIIGGIDMGCVCAKVTDEYHGWECKITGGACSFLTPNQDACADMYGEVEHTKRWEEKHKKDDNHQLEEVAK